MWWQWLSSDCRPNPHEFEQLLPLDAEQFIIEIDDEVVGVADLYVYNRPASSAWISIVISPIPSQETLHLAVAERIVDTRSTALVLRKISALQYGMSDPGLLAQRALGLRNAVSRTCSSMPADIGRKARWPCSVMIGLPPRRRAPTMKIDLSLRPLLPSDYAKLYQVVQKPGVGYRWRFRDRSPSYEQFMKASGRACFYRPSSRKGGEDLVGLISAYNPDYRNGTCEVALVQDPEVPAGLALVGMARFLQGFFANFPFRFVIATSYDFSLVSFAKTMERFAEHRGTLKEDLHWRGRFHDKHVFTVHRSFLKAATPAELRMLAGKGSGARGA